MSTSKSYKGVCAITPASRLLSVIASASRRIQPQQAATGIVEIPSHGNFIVIFSFFSILLSSVQPIFVCLSQIDESVLIPEMTDKKDDVQGVAELLAKAKVEQINVVSFKGKSFKLNSADDGKVVFL